MHRGLRRALLGASACVFLLPSAPVRASTTTATTTKILFDDAVLAGLIDESLSRRPELARAQAMVRAERERAVRARALPDPGVSIGIQNDGFTSIEIGTMETSFLSIAANQSFPWPGKRDLRGEIALLGAREAELALERATLTTEADVRRAYVDVLLARGRLALLDELAMLWQRSEGITKARYEAGEGAQSDVLRAQLERSRIEKRRWALEAEARSALQALNRLRDRPLDAPISTDTALSSFAQPDRGDTAREVAGALGSSPELAIARIAIDRANAGARLAEKEIYPDIAVSLGFMQRGALPPMWQANVGVTLPIFAGSKQSREIAANGALADAGKFGAAELELELRQRVEQRATALELLLDTIALFQKGLLVQSSATAESTLAQYRVGSVGFASVMEAIAGYIGDKDELLGAIAAAHRIAIARDEISLEAPAGAGASSSGSSRMQSAAATGAPRSTTTAGEPATPGAAESARGMGGM